MKETYFEPLDMLQVEAYACGVCSYCWYGGCALFGRERSVEEVCIGGARCSGDKRREGGCEVDVVREMGEGGNKSGGIATIAGMGTWGAGGVL